VNSASQSRIAATAGAGVLLALGAWYAYRLSSHSASKSRGNSIFHGEIVVPGRLEGHDTPLPAMAARCSNCHEARNISPAGGATNSGAPATTGSFAAPLNREWLSTDRPRRGGPPTHYRSSDLCALLRTGIDPGHIILPTIMPRYEISNMQCADLWTYLESR
jgi:hypothetical protein